MHVGERICALRKREKVRQNVLARMVGITPGALTNFEKGRRHFWDLSWRLVSFRHLDSLGIKVWKTVVSQTLR